MPDLERSWLEGLCRGIDPEADARPAGGTLSFRQFVTRVRPGYRWYWHCVALAAVLQRVADGELKRVMVFMPPRHGKSELVSRLFTAYYLYRYPHRWVGLSSYGADLAETLARSAQANYVKSGGKLRGGSTAVKHWETPQGGGMWAAGVGGPIAGKGFHLGVIDDPVKNYEEACSEVQQQKQREWYSTTFYSREEPASEDDPTSPVVVIQTRWHEGDLAGWLLDQEKAKAAGEDEADDEDGPEHWHIVSMAAIKDEAPHDFPPTCTVEPDPRGPGEALCPERRPVGKLRKIAAKLGEFFFSALFQQRPMPPGGGMFKNFPVVHALPSGCRFVRYWDKAGTQGGGAYTAGCKMAVTPNGIFIITHMVRGQWSAGERERIIRQTAESDGHDVTVWVEQEPGSGGKESAENTVINLAGYTCHIERVTGDKETRARPMAAQAEVGNVLLYAGGGTAWHQPFTDEARLFPNGRYKDQIDAAGGAFNKLALMLRPIAGTSVPAAALPPVPAWSGGDQGIPAWRG